VIDSYLEVGHFVVLGGMQQPPHGNEDDDADNDDAVVIHCGGVERDSGSYKYTC
jgi:hypothetical protein